MAFIGILIFWAISFVAGQLLRAALTKVHNAKADDVQAPRTEEGGQIPAIFGTVKLGPTVLWFGDIETTPVKKRIKTSLFTSTRQTIGYRYLVGLQGGLCWGPVDELVEIILDGKHNASEITSTTERLDAGPGSGTFNITYDGVTPALPLAYAAGGTAITFEAPFVYGGQEKEGGIAGTVQFYFGSTTQNANAYLATATGQSPFPAYRGLCYVVWEQIITGQVPQIKPWQFVVRRCPTTLGTLAADVTLSRIGDDANPAEIIYELWTDTRWGLGESAGSLDTASFLAALQTLSDEGLGISGTFVGSGNADEKLKEILRTIDGVLVSDPLTGKLRLTLIRADYTAADLETFTAANSRDLSVSRPELDELTTEVKVRYADSSQGFTTRVRAAYNPAARQALSIARGVTVDYSLVTTGTNAETLAVRDLKALSSTLATGSVTLPRVAATLAPGDPFILDYPDRGLTSTVVRATRINYGSIHGRSAVEVQWTEDVFGVSGGIFTTDPPDVWTPPTPPSFGNVVVIPNVTTDATQTCVSLDITGRVDLIGTIEMRGQKGGEAAGAWTAFAIDDPPTLCVDRDELLEGVIAWRVTVTDPDGTTDTIEDEVPVPPLGVDDGNAEGTPGNWPLTMRAGPPLVLTGVPATLTEPTAARTDRVWVSLSKVAALFPQIGNGAALVGGEFVLMYSLTGAAGSFVDLGPSIPLDTIRYPAFGDPTAPDAPAVAADRVCLSWGVRGGDGTVDALAEITNIYVVATSATPPVAPEPPEPPDVPTGEPWGNLILWLDAQDTELAALFNDGDPMTFWPDRTDITGAATPYGGLTPFFQLPGTYHTAGFDGGALPRVSLAGGTSAQGFSTAVPTVDSCTFYFVADVTTGGGSQGAGGTTGNAPIIVSHSGNHSNGWVSVRTDGTIQAGVNAGSFGYPSAVGATDITDGPHIIRFAWRRDAGSWFVFVDGALECSVEGNALVNGINTWGGIARFYYGGLYALSDGIQGDYGEVLCYDRAHITAGMNAIETALATKWGL
jgi:hypothetical protein